MKKLNLDDIDSQASFFIYLVNKSRLEVAMTYNIISSAMAANMPLNEIRKKIAGDYPSIVNNTIALESILDKIDKNFEMVSYTSESLSIVGTIKQQLFAIKNQHTHDNNMTKHVTRYLFLIGMVFSSLEKLNDTFISMCERSDINYRKPMSWTDNEDFEDIAPLI